jgi:hypothetical protein
VGNEDQSLGRMLTGRPESDPVMDSHCVARAAGLKGQVTVAGNRGS